MLKILFYNHTGQVGGAERLLLTLLQRLNRGRFAPVLVCPEGPLQELANQTGVRIQTIDGLKARFTWRADQLVRYLYSFAQVILELRTQVIDAQPDLIHANSVRAGLVATVATFGLRQNVIWHVHDLLPRHPFNLVIRTIAAISRRTRIIAVAEASANRFAGKFMGLRSRVQVIPNAIDSKIFSARTEARQRIRQELRVEKDDPVIGMVGRITPRKGQLEMLKLFPKVLEKFPRATLVVAGAPAFNNEHEYLELLKQTITDLKISSRVVMMGPRSDVPDIFQALDLLVVNSETEACSLVILEAMACGTPVLATSTGGTPELIEHEQTGWLISWRNDDELENGILTLLAAPDLRSKLAVRARRKMSSFSIERLMADVEDFYLSAFAQQSDVPELSNPAEIKTANFA